MDMGSMTMSMEMATPTSPTAAMTSTAMDMSHDGMGNGCKISMTWNWYTVDACFISTQWRITSSGMFAGSCIGVILLVMSLGLLRRVDRSYKRSVIRGIKAHKLSGSMNPENLPTVNAKWATVRYWPLAAFRQNVPGPGRPTMLQHLIQCILYTLEFGVAYFVMLLAMYYNGYIIICILIGAFLGQAVFGWDVSDSENDAMEVTICCG